ncbi:hypothetical protein [Aquabacter spiritensis]|uniref:Uncharacterized protein n=1 Tax=Aquabacter spiritensis TaxID=933073 RepID=A0A4R3LS58_9HYPH|nr:hypothetical protein [Aquabacter spiritensis]TCT03181.1 hypothetical protein EDC64_11044 [Aquabacter spiritensis]
MERGLHRRWAGAGIAAVMAVVAAVVPVRAANILLDNFWLPNDSYSGDLPACTEPLALGTISMRFAETERMYWNAALNIKDFFNVREIAFRPWGEGFQPRRYCSATVTLSDQRRHPIYYSIIADSSFQGYTWGVEWCVEGLDKSLAYAPNCKMARP